MLNKPERKSRPLPNTVGANKFKPAGSSARAALKNKVVLPGKLKSASSMRPSRPLQKPKHNTSNNAMGSAQDRRYIEEIRKLLQVPPYSDMLIKATGPKGDTKEIYETLLKNKEFSKYPSYGNEDKAEFYASELAGLGIIQYLLNQSKKPGHERITDIGFNSNGYLTIETNARKFVYGQRPGHMDEPKITREYIESLIRRMSQQNGYAGDRFDKNKPLFNGSNEENYLRISANHPAIAPYGITASIRVASPYLALTKKNFDNFAPMNRNIGDGRTINVYNLFNILVKCHCNILLSAETGAGKTEFQKLLVGFIPFQDRIIMVEDTNETHLPDLYPDKDIFSWLTNADIKITDLVKQALRNNPKWLIIAETRGAEAYEMFQGVKSDHAIITTLHSISNEAVPSRFVGMCESGDFKVNEETLERDFLRYMDIGVHLTKKVINGRVFRYADEIAEFVPESKEHPNGINVLFHQHLRHDGVREYWTGKPSNKLQTKFYNERDKKLTPQEWPIIPESHPVKERLYDIKEGK